MIDETIGTQDAVVEESKPVEEQNDPETGLEPQQDQEQAEGAEVKKKKTSGFHRKISRLEREKAEIAAERAQLTEELNKYRSSSAKLDKEPQLEDYKDWSEFNRATIQYGVQQELKQRDQALQKQKDSEERQKIAHTWKQKVEALIDSDDKYEDFEEVTGYFKDKYVHPAINQALGDSDVGAQLAYYLGENPEVVEDLNKKTPFAIAKELAKIEASFSKPAVNKISKSSPPITPVKGSAKTATKLDALDTNSFLAQRYPHLLKRK